MRSSQINFYLTSEDILEIEEYIKERQILIIPQPQYSKELQFSNSLTEYDGKKLWSDKYLVLKENVDLVLTNHIDTQNYYLVNVLDSPVIEFSNCIIKNNIMSRGRIYYTKTTYDKEGNLLEKPASFLQTTHDLFKWIKKRFKPNKDSVSTMAGMEMFLISERTLKWIQETNGSLADSKQKNKILQKKNVA